MKRIVELLTLFVACAAGAQTAPSTTTPPPVTQPPPATQPPPVTEPAAPGSSQVPPEPLTPPGPLPNRTMPPSPIAATISNTFNTPSVLSNRFAVSNQFTPGNPLAEFPAVTNGAGVDEAGALLLNLQVNIQEILPVLASLTAGLNTRAVTPAQAAATANERLRLRGRAPGQPFLGRVGTNTVAMNPATFQLLTAAQDDLQRILPVLQQLNGANRVATAAQGASVNFVNRFSIVTNSMRTRVLEPTGR